MKRIINIISLCAAIFILLPINASAQAQNDALYVYRNDGSFNAFLREDIDSIVLSRYDTDEVYQDEYVTQEFYTPDSIYRIPIAAIDSVGLVQPETKYQDNVLLLYSEYLPYILEASDSTITFNSTTPAEMLPQIGNVIAAMVFDSPLDKGFAGKVESIERNTDRITYYCSEVTINDIYKQIVYTGRFTTYAAEDSLNNLEYQNHTRGGGSFEHVSLGTIKASAGIASLAATPTVSGYYTINLNENLKTHLALIIKMDIPTELSISGKITNPNSDPIIAWCPTSIPIPTEVPGLYGKIKGGAFFNISASADISAKWPGRLYGKVGIMMGDDGITTINTIKYKTDMPEISLNMNGEVDAGLCARIEFCVITDKLLSLYLTGYGGIYASSDFALTTKGLLDGTLYSSLKDTKVELGGFFSGEPGYSIKGEEQKIHFPGTDKIELSWGKRKNFELGSWYLLPEFSEPVYTKGDDVTTAILTTTPSRDLLLPVKLGVSVETEDDELVDTQWEETSYRIKDNWISDELSKTFDDLKAGNYKAYPYVEIMGIEMKATPSSSFSVEGVVTTGEASDITDKTAVLSGSEEGYDLSDTSARTGFCYSSQVQTPTLSDATTATANTSKDFTASITGLESGTTYYYCAYFKNSKGVKYGEVKTFTTKKVVTSNADGITDKLATLKGYIEGCNFSTESVEVGFCYSDTYTEPDKSNSLISGTLSGEAFSAALSNLEANTTYYYRAYGLMGDTYMYGDVMSFKTKESEKIVVTLDASDVKGTSATLNGKIQGYDLTDATLSVGFCYSPSAIAEPDVNNSTTVSATKEETFSYTLSELTNGNTYSYRAYVKVSDSYVYGETKYFTPNSGSKLSSITSVGDYAWTFVYDDQGRILELDINKDEEENDHLYLTYDSDGVLTGVKQWDVDEWLYWTNIKLTPEGYIKSLHWSAGGESGSTTCSYDEDGHLVKAKNGDGLSGINLSWENGCLTSLRSYDNDTSDDDEPYSETIYYGYGDDENPQLQWSMATGMWTEMVFTGFFGKASSKLPNAYIADGEKIYVSYTKNDNGTIATEMFSIFGSSITFNYSYEDSKNSATQTRSQSATINKDMKIFTSILPRLFGKKR